MPASHHVQVYLQCKVCLFPGSMHQASQPNAQLQIHHKLSAKAQKLLTVNTCLILDKHSVQKSMQNPSAARVCVRDLRGISKILLIMLWQLIPVALYLTLMLLLHEDGYSVPYRTNVKNVHSFTSTPAHFMSTVCKNKNNLTFTFLRLNLKEKKKEAQVFS